MKGVIFITAPNGDKERIVKSWVIKWGPTLGTHSGKTIVWLSATMFMDIKETVEEFDALYEEA